MNRTSTTARTSKQLIMGLSLSLDTFEHLQSAADRRRDREALDRARQRKKPLSYAQRMVLQGAR